MNMKKNCCQKPEQLKDKPENCSSEQIRQCHGEVQEHPCTTDSGCEQPENLKHRPQECAPEQIRQRHGESGDHPCENVDT